MEHNLEEVEAQVSNLEFSAHYLHLCHLLLPAHSTFNRKQKKNIRIFCQTLRAGDLYVLTSGGIYGRVTGIKDDKITVEISDKVRVKVNLEVIIAGVVKQDVLKSNWTI